MILESQSKSKQSGYGVFSINESIELSKFIIQVNVLEDNQYSYLRTLNEKDVFTKVFTSKSSNVQIQITPILPQNIPDKITNYTMLKFTESLQIERQTSSKFEVLFPVEIGVFAMSEGKQSLIECFSVDPSVSRYGMYGTPNDGILCKCFKISLDKKQPTPFLHSNMSLNFENRTESDVVISKLVFPSTNHNIFYKSDQAVTDGVICVIKDILGKKIAEINSQYNESMQGFTTSPRIDEKTSGEFTMDRGIV